MTSFYYAQWHHPLLVTDIT